MSFETFSEFLAMGGHAPYVWSSYALTLIVMLINLMQAVRLRKQFFREQARQLKREEKHASGT